MSLARATLPADRRDLFDAGYERSVRSRDRNDETDSWRPLPHEIEHSHHVGRVLSVR
jgi:hypothetical protein